MKWAIISAFLCLPLSAQTWTTVCNGDSSGAGSCAPGTDYANARLFYWKIPYDSYNHKILYFAGNTSATTIYSYAIWEYSTTTHKFVQRVTNGMTGNPAACYQAGAPYDAFNPLLGHPSGNFTFSSNNNKAYSTLPLCETQYAGFTNVYDATTQSMTTRINNSPFGTGAGVAASNYGAFEWSAGANKAVYVAADISARTVKEFDGTTYTDLTGTDSGTGPTFITAAAFVSDGTNLWWYGGCNGSTPGNGGSNPCSGTNQNDLYKYVVPTKVWTKLSPVGGVKPPITRASFPMFTYDSSRSRFLLYAGDGDLWKYVISTNTWSQVTTSGTCSVFDSTVINNSSGNSAQYDASTDTLVLMWGKSQNNSPGVCELPLGGAATTSGQFRILATWPSGNAKWILVSGLLGSLSAGGTATVTLTGPGGLSVPLTVQEALYPGSTSGVARTNEPFSMGVPIADSVAITSTTGLALSGTAAVTDANMATNNQDCAAGSDTNRICVNTGAAKFEVKKANTNIIDKVVVGSTTVVASSTAATRGLVLTGPDPTASYPGNVTCSPDAGGSTCATAYSSANDSGSTCLIETNGPVLAVVTCVGTHFDSASHPYMQFTTRTYFYSGKSSVKVTSVLRNANWSTAATPSADNAGGTFNSAFKGMAAYELRVAQNIAGTLNYSIATDTTPQTGTLTGSDSAYMYQGISDNMLDSTHCGGTTPGSCLASWTTDLGYVVKKNSTTLASGDRTKVIGGWADISDGSGVGVELGVYQAAGNFPISLEFNGGGADARIGILSRKNSQAVYQPWPQWKILDVFLNFHATAPASLANHFLKFQHYLVVRPSTVAYINNTGVFSAKIPTAAQEDAFYVSLASVPPAVPLGYFCFGGGTSNCTPDLGTVNVTSFPLSIVRSFPWNSGGGATQEEFRWSDMLRFLQRGQTGRFLNSMQHYQYQSGYTWPHSDGVTPSDSTINGFTWRSRTPWCTPTGVGENCAGNSNAELSSAGRPWLGFDGNYSVVTNGSKASASASYPDTQHFHWSGQTDFYLFTGDETLREAMVPLKDWYLNPGTGQAAVNGNILISRDVGEALFGAARYGIFLNSIGDTVDGAAVIASGVTVYNRRVKSIPCVNGFPTGCTPPPVNTEGTSPPTASPTEIGGVSRERGLHIGGRGTSWCAYNDLSGQAAIAGAHRLVQPYHQSILVEGLVEMLKLQGTSWSEYNTALDLAFGVSQWTMLEGYNDDGTNNWCPSTFATCLMRDGGSLTPSYDERYNSFRYMVKPDFGNQCPGGRTAYDPGSGDEVYGMPNGHTYDGYTRAYAGGAEWNPMYAMWLVTGKTDWARQLKHSIINSAVHSSGWAPDFGGYSINNLIAILNNPGTTTLQDIAVTNVNNLGGGVQRISYTVPAGSSAPRLKYDTTRTVQGDLTKILQFDNLVTNAFTTDPATNRAWFAATDATASLSAWTAGAHTADITTGASTLSASNFSLKAMQPISCTITPTSLPGGTVGVFYSLGLTATSCGAGSWSVSSGSLCIGLSLGSGTGIISGTPTTAQSCSFTVAYDTASQPLTIVISSGGAPTRPRLAGSTRIRATIQ